MPRRAQGPSSPGRQPTPCSILQIGLPACLLRRGGGKCWQLTELLTEEAEEQWGKSKSDSPASGTKLDLKKAEQNLVLEMKGL